MVRPQEEMNYFAVMGLTPSATEGDIRKAYRKLSLALHPDKNRGMDPEVASGRFHEMQLAYEVLMDPAARLAAAERNKADEARRERRGAYEGKRKEMAEELERREEEEKSKRFKGVQDEKKRQATLEKLREEGRKLREAKELKRLEAEEKAREQREQSQAQGRQQDQQHNAVLHSPTPPPNQPELGPLDLTVRLRFPVDQFAHLSSSSSSAASDDPLDTPLARGLEAQFGKLDSLLWKRPKADRKKTGEITAHATFKTLDAAFAAVKAGSQLRAGGAGAAEVLEDVWIGWAAGTRSSEKEADGRLSGEPARVTWLRKQGRLSDGSSSSSHRSTDHTHEDDRLQRHVDDGDSIGSGTQPSSSFPSFSFSAASSLSQGSHSSQRSGGSPMHSLADFETSTLQRMREAERKRMEGAIRRADEQTAM